MRVIFSEDHKLRNARTELYGGELVPPFEAPFRAEWIVAAVKDAGFTDIAAPERHDVETALKVHDAGYLAFLEVAWEKWKAAGYRGEAIATSFPVRRTSPRIPTQIDGLLGYYCNATETAITPGTWEAAVSSMQSAVTAADIVAGGDKAAFALCRPPGHHAGIDSFGGYCFINNAAVAAQRFLDKGARKVAILDVDFHHGNGTQDIFYERGDVYFASLHGDPAEAFPHFLGYAEETGKGAGAGTTQNYPLPPGTPYSVWEAALHDALKRIAAFGAEVIVLSLGVDTFEKDPISFFKLVSPDYITMGQAVAASGVPVLVVMEGGYGVPEIGLNVANTLKGIAG